jgi:hypothetical protein
MHSTRRQFARTIAAVAGATGLLGAGLGAAATDDDDDDLDLPANVFISPHGQPFRARMADPYPVANWFLQANRKLDGKVDHAQFLADAELFFHFLDFGKHGVIDPFDVSVYEHRVAPEILGQRVDVGALAPRWPRAVRDGPARLWLAQTGAPSGEIVPGGGEPAQPTAPKTLDESQAGASPYSFFDEPEPVTTADFDFRGFITRENFLKLADMHFTSLDHDKDGFLTLEKLPKTDVQKKLEAARRKRS